MRNLLVLFAYVSLAAAQSKMPLRENWSIQSSAEVRENGAALSAVGFAPQYLAKYGQLSCNEAWAKQVLREDCQCVRFEDMQDPAARARMAESGIREMVTLALRGKEGPLGIISVGSNRPVEFLPDEVAYLVNLSNLLGLTLQNVKLFEQVATAQQQWADTVDSIGEIA